MNFNCLRAVSERVYLGHRVSEDPQFAMALEVQGVKTDWDYWEAIAEDLSGEDLVRWLSLEEAEEGRLRLLKRHRLDSQKKAA